MKFIQEQPKKFKEGFHNQMKYSGQFKFNNKGIRNKFNETIKSKENSSIMNKANFHNNSKAILAKSLFEVRKKLPIYAIRHQLVTAIDENETIILIGETGCGKTTQIPQFIMKSYLAKKMKNCSVCITQPRRVAAISIATRVAQETGTELGQLVGYCVRFDDNSSERTKIKYMTDGMLLRETLNDGLLKKYTVIILDEAHERSIQTDVTLTLVKNIQKQRRNTDNPLKLIVMSATMNVDKFSDFFSKAPVYYLQGRAHPIKIYYSEEELSDYQHSALITVFQIHQNEPDGDILVFCTGQEEIESLINSTKQIAIDLPIGCKKLEAYPLYSALPTELQMKVFKTSDNTTRKVIFSTNIAETSITIPGIKYVIDTGKVKCRTFNPITGVEMLKVVDISKSQAQQRAGRAGRESSGFCYRLYTQEQHRKLSEFSVPELLRSNLSNVLLHLSALNITNYTTFDFMDKPSLENIQNSTNLLMNIGAITKIDDFSFKLTDLGKQMTIFPLDPKLSKMLIDSLKFNCTEEILTIISLMYVDSIFFIPTHKRQVAFDVIKKFTSSEGDHIPLLNVYKAYKSVNGNKEWCKENFINTRNMKTVMDVRKQLTDLCTKANFEKKSCSEQTEQIRRCMVHAFALNIATLQKEGHYKTEATKEKVYIHPSSCLHSFKPDCVIFTELIQTTKCYIRQLSLIDKNWINQNNQ